MAAAWTSSFSEPVGLSFVKKHVPAVPPQNPQYRRNGTDLVSPSPAHHKRQLIDQVQNLLSGEETSEMLYEKRKFEGAIEDFLSCTPHRLKFSFAVTAELFQDGIMSPEFSAKSFMSAWEHLSRYAMNLLSRPWRCEYHALKLYSGFYKHFVEPVLPEGFRIFGLMGYSRCPGENRYELRLTGPIDPDAVMIAYLDCAIAAVECDMMTRIMARLRDLQVTWADVLYVRERFVCNVEEASNIVRREYWENEAKLHREEALGLNKPAYDALEGPSAGVPSLNVQPAFYHGTLFRNPGFSFDQSDTQPLVDVHSPEFPNRGKQHAFLTDFPERVLRPSAHSPDLPVRSKRQGAPVDVPDRPLNQSLPQMDSWSCQKPDISPAKPKIEKKSPGSSDVINALKSLKFSEKIKGRDSFLQEKKAKQQGKWSCHACTFLNSADALICAMCSKSCRRGAEEKPLIIGGKECLSCTYVNDRNVDECMMCQDSLINCPTYT